jgi:integrase
MLYRGASAARTELVAHQISNGEHGLPILERLPLVERIYEYIDAKLVGGGSRGTAQTTIRRLREFFSWADRENRSVDIPSVECTFIEWTDYLIHRKRIIGDVKEIHLYQSAVAVAKVLDSILELTNGLIAKTRMRRPRGHKSILGTEADKQNLEHMFAFGHALLDITNALTVDVIRGPIPILIQFRTGQKYEEWLRLKPAETLKSLSEKARPSATRTTLAKRQRWQSDQSLRNRYPLANMRVQAEMLVFISQTGMNLEQVHQLKMGKFRYASHHDGYQVYRVYKGRRHGEVIFEIFSAYREILERYLAWRNIIFPDDEEGLLFPLIGTGRVPLVAPAFSLLHKVCDSLGIQFIGPRALRKTRINWLLRRSRDDALTAEMHAHTQETLIRNYEQPSLQVAMSEISRFHLMTFQGKSAAGPGICALTETNPKALPFTPSEATVPDCVSPAGCLFCENQRDIDSEDHVWSLASYRHLKSLELARFRPHTDADVHHPALATIDRITAKLRSFETSSEVRALWVSEALSRVAEGYQHPRWDGFVRLMEMKT